MQEKNRFSLKTIISINLLHMSCILLGGCQAQLLQHEHIDLGSILVIACEKELWHNLGARSQLIWPGWLRRRNSCTFHLIPRSLHAICGGSGVQPAAWARFLIFWKLCINPFLVFPWSKLETTQNTTKYRWVRFLMKGSMPCTPFYRLLGVWGQVCDFDLDTILW